MENFDFILNLILPIFIAVVTAWFTVRFSLGRFYSQKWWEKRWEAYVTIIECLHHMKRLFSVEIDAKLEDRIIPEKKKKELQKKHSKSYEELLKQIDIGQLILSSEALRELKDFRMEYEKDYDLNYWFGYIEGSWKAIDGALKNFCEIAKNDLKQKKL